MRPDEVPQLLQKWLWMRQLDYAGIFWTLLSVKWGMACVAFIVAFLFLWLNIRQAARNSFALAMIRYGKGSRLCREDAVSSKSGGIAFSRRVVMRAVALAAAAVAAIFALGFYTQWDTCLRFRYGGSFGLADPVFGVDLGFYLFRLPWYELLQSSLVFLTVLAIVASLPNMRTSGSCGSTGRRQIETWGNAVQHFRYSFSFWPLRLDGVITWIGSICSIPPQASSMELDIRRLT